jgi:hypothetical protein
VGNPRAAGLAGKFALTFAAKYGRPSSSAPAFTWNPPPYEYEEVKLPIDILAGTDRLRKDIESGKDIDGMEKWWQEETKSFEKIRKKCLLY